MKISHAGNKHGLIPDAAGICDSFGIPQRADKGKNIPQRHPGMNCDQPVPHLEGDVGLAAGKRLEIAPVLRGVTRDEMVQLGSIAALKRSDPEVSAQTGDFSLVRLGLKRRKSLTTLGSA